MSADPLSPERGSYRFAQEMLRQVAYDTLSRRDRKARHLTVAAHLRAAFPGDGEEVADVIARHYLDALDAVPEDPDAGQIRGQAIAALIRAAERAERTGAPARAATSYATAAQLTQAGHRRTAQTADAPAARCGNAPPRPPSPAPTGPPRSSTPAAPATTTCSAAQHPGGRPRPGHRRAGAAPVGPPRRGARAAHRRPGRCCGPTPTPTPSAPWSELATLEVFAGSPDADRLTTEALALGQALDVGAGQLAGLFITRGIYLGMAGRRPEAVAYFREAARLAEQAGDNARLGRVLLNLADALAVTDPAAAAEAARTAAGHLRRAGDRDYLAYAVTNLAQALLHAR